jgi:parvulin-like peptidyl-prolyl isomerase
VSRREKEAQQRRRLYWILGIASALIVAVLAVSALNEYWIKPRHVLASVNGVDIRRQDYWKYRAVDLADQANQYASIAQSPFVDESQKQQYITLAQQASAEIDKVWGSTSVDDATLQRMIDDQVYLQSTDEFGITITDDDVENFIHQRFEPPEAPIFTPTPTQTLIPERAEWATQTAAALAQGDATSTPELASPVASAVADGSPQASPIADVSPIGSPVSHVASPAGVAESSLPAGESTPQSETSPASAADIASPVSGSPEPAANETATVQPTPTMSQDQARQTATANFEDYEDAIFERAHLSRADYERLIVRPAIARERIDAALTADVGQQAEQVHAAHILVDTKDLADSIYQDVTQGGVDFAQAAKDQSVDSGTAANGGDLGWFTRGQMVDPFEEVAFSTPPGQISQPVQTEFGWHIIEVIAHEQNRAMTDDQISAMRTSLTTDWLTTRKREMNISSEIDPTPTPSAPENFVPPPDAPPIPTLTEIPVEASPAASPSIDPAPPVTSPEVLPATPIVPNASPMASPVS